MGLDGQLVELEGVRKVFGSNVVLDGIDLSIARGEAIVIAGPSGSGKSTMLRCINGLESIDAGSITFDGHRIDTAGRALARLRTQIGMVFQQFNLFPHMTVERNITLAPVKAKGLSEARGEDEGAGAARAGRDPGEGGRLSRRPLGRSAAARGDRPGAGDGAEAHALRRADVRARPGDDP